MLRSHLVRTVGLGLTIAALSASTAGALPSDLRTPDAIDAAQPKTAAPAVDMRTPDAKDLGQGRGTFSAPDFTVVRVVDPQPTGTGFDWGDAGIGAGGLLGLVLIALGGTAAVAHHRHRPRTPTTA
jgi:hypothetical protein